MDPATLESIARLKQLPHWEKLREAATTRLERIEASQARLLFKTRSKLDPQEVIEEIEFYRGFRQGVMFVLDGLPNTAERELKELLNDNEKEVD